ncbi:hypothetical protein G6F65_014534 [Rhizopus arrhizus]|nr:hypothetical protein G6F65_014534 [Rhizopus arrhizus]
MCCVAILAWHAQGWFTPALRRYREFYTQDAGVRLSEVFLFIDPAQLWAAAVACALLAAGLALSLTGSGVVAALVAGLASRAATKASGSLRTAVADGVADVGVGLACGCRAGDGIAARCGAEQRTAGAGIRFDAARAAHGRAVGCRAREPACPDAGRFHFAGGGRHADCRADGRKTGRSTGEHCADLAGAVAVAGEVAGADVPRAVAGLDRWRAAFAAAGGAGPAGAGNHGGAMAYADGVGRAGHRGGAGNRRDSVIEGGRNVVVPGYVDVGVGCWLADVVCPAPAAAGRAGCRCRVAVVVAGRLALGVGSSSLGGAIVLVALAHPVDAGDRASCFAGWGELCPHGGTVCQRWRRRGRTRRGNCGACRSRALGLGALDACRSIGGRCGPWALATRPGGKAPPQQRKGFARRIRHDDTVRGGGLERPGCTADGRAKRSARGPAGRTCRCVGRDACRSFQGGGDQGLGRPLQ